MRWQLFCYILLFLFAGQMHATILVIDYKSPITPYITYYIQRAQVHCVVCDHTITSDELNELSPQGIILSGGPSSVCHPNSPTAPKDIFGLGIPILGICYGQQLMSVMQGGTVERMLHVERGPTELVVTDTCLLTKDLWSIGDKVHIWMGHEDRIVDIPKGFTTIAHTAGSPHAVIADDTRKLYGVQFHPEAPRNSCPELIEQFVVSVVGEQPDPTVVAQPVDVDEWTTFRNLLFGCCGPESCFPF